MKMNRRGILKLSAGALLAALVSPLISAQSGKAPGASLVAGELTASKVDGNISYNAGWVVPLEDKAALLELEARKTKERDDLVKQKAGTASDSAGAAKDQSKSIGKRFQELLGKVKSFF
jgi:hypothetical protein